VGDPPGLVIYSDACKGLEKAMGAVFQQAENRECMRHLYQNFMKHYSGDVFTDHLYHAARSYTYGMFKWHMKKITEFAPDAIEYLHQHHSRIWYRSAFSKLSKCDYLTNNVSESFNAQIRKLKGLHLHELVYRLRELIIEKRYIRKKIARQWQDGILPGVIKDLNAISNHLRVVKIAACDVALQR
jgi:transposase-like protein